MKRIFLLCAAALCLTVVHAQEPLTLSLATCREMALGHNEDLQRADNAVRQAELDKRIAFAAYLPKFDAMAMGTYMFPDLDMMGMELQMHGMYLAGITLMQPLYTGGKIRAGNRLAEIGRTSMQENRRKTRMQVLADADKAYWNFIAVAWKVRMLEAYKTQMDSLYRQVETSLAAGMATENDLLRIRTKQSDIRYQWQKARNGANLCRLALCNVIGCPLETQIVPTDTVVHVAPAAPMDTDISQRPELALLRKQVEADANGNAFPYTQRFNDGIGLVMASVSIPIFHWGENQRKVKKAKLDVENARLDLQQNTRLLSIEAQQAVQNVMDSYRLIETAELGAAEAGDNLRILRDRYLNGMCTLTDLLDAQSQWQQAESNLIDARTQCKIYETEYLRVTGRLE